MTFKLKPDATFVKTVQIPNGDFPLPLKVRYKRKGRTELVDFTTRAPQLDDRDMVLEIVDGFEYTDFDFTRDALGEMFENYPGAALAIYVGYLDGLQRAERKN